MERRYSVSGYIISIQVICSEMVMTSIIEKQYPALMYQFDIIKYIFLVIDSIE